MKNIIFNVERTKDGYSAYTEAAGMGIAATIGVTAAELKQNALEAYNALLLDHNKKPVNADVITLAYDIPQFFEYYKVLNASQLAKHIPMNRALLSQYITGKKAPSKAQQHKILQGIRNLGKELVSVDLID